MVKMKLLEIKAYVVKENNYVYHVCFKHGNKWLNGYTYDVGVMSKPRLIRDPLSWAEDIPKMVVPKTAIYIHSHWFKGQYDIWIRLGHAIDILEKYFKEYSP